MKTTEICHACGTQLPITAKFCLGCNSAVSKPSEAISQPKHTDVAEKSSNTVVIIASVVAIVMVYGIWVKSKSSETLGVDTTPAQTQATPAVAIIEQTQELLATNAGTDKEWAKDDLVANGKTVYEKNCAVCHQTSGAGLPPAFPALTGGKITIGPVADHLALVLNGKNIMPTWKVVLNDVEIASVITYVRNALGNSVGDFVQPAQVKAAR